MRFSPADSGIWAPDGARIQDPIYVGLHGVKNESDEPPMHCIGRATSGVIFRFENDEADVCENARNPHVLLSLRKSIFPSRMQKPEFDHSTFEEVLSLTSSGLSTKMDHIRSPSAYTLQGGREQRDAGRDESVSCIKEMMLGGQTCRLMCCPYEDRRPLSSSCPPDASQS
ncbi:hypothetical protein NDU88_000900 [Pleurodeles waltl]|uniref:Uncharacterized protein n=1 Tax=Pleurodeles waltl TaxID=8319 RepID=A0AAV7R722_PLEWA|nr:hypothetical protein NDU88_000900 [Pleurodeles waltl]